MGLVESQLAGGDFLTRPTIELDPTDVEVYGKNRRGVAFNYPGHPLGEPPADRGGARLVHQLHVAVVLCPVITNEDQRHSFPPPGPPHPATITGCASLSLTPPGDPGVLAEAALRLQGRVAGRGVTVLVSDRFSMVTMADLIVVLESGRLTAPGSHAELVSRLGLYQELFGSQARAYR